MNKLLMASEAARKLGISPNGARWLADAGKLKCIVTNNGTRLFDESIVDELAQERANNKLQQPLPKVAA